MSIRWSLLVVVVGCGADSSPLPVPPDGPPPLACPEDTSGGALALDGIDDHAATAATPAHGLEAFTIEAWVRRDGEGATFTTGAGGLVMTPIAAKGLGEGGEGTNIDCNYGFGFAGHVLGADFEDAATGANHPITGKTAIAIGEWHHVAATYDGATWRLFVDGNVDAELAANATPRADSVHPFAMGTAIDSEGVAHGALHGSLDEVRLWNRARTPEEIADGLHKTIAMADGLVGRWALDLGDPATAADTAGGATATLVGATLVADDVALDQGTPPVIGSASPADGAMSGPDVTLDLALELSARVPVDVTYHLRELGTADDFTIVVMPDTQIYTIEGRNLEKYFHDQTKWIRANRKALNIVGVIHNGDVINNEPQLYQWNVADAALARLETPEDDLPEGMPYGVGVGNHDNKLTGDNTVPNTAKFNQFFGVARYANRSYYGGHYGTTNNNSWVTFSAGGLDFVVVNVEYALDQDPAVLAWARSIFAMYPDAFGILNTHFLLTSGGNFGTQSRKIYEGLKDLPNVNLMTGGHIASESRRTDTFMGHTIHSMLADYQGREDGGQGYLRVWEFSPANGTVSVRTYSPTLDKYETDADSEFTLDVDLRGAGGPFREIAITGAEPDAIATPVDGIEVGKTYEWFADVETCGKRVVSPLYRFTTLASAAAARKINDALHQPLRRNRPKHVTSGPVNPRPDDPTLAD